MTSWLSYGGGVNSTALAVLLCSGRLPEFLPWRCLFADTLTERPETYTYIDRIMVPYLSRYGVVLERTRGAEGVLERWERLHVTGSKMIRSCTVEAKINPIRKYLELQGSPDDIQLIGISAEEAHRAERIRRGRPTRFPLVELNIDRAGCIDIIRGAGLCVPTRSGCWCCPFLRVAEILDLIRSTPERFERIVTLERRANETHPGTTPRTQWGNRTTDYWFKRSIGKKMQGELFDSSDDMPCLCWAE